MMKFVDFLFSISDHATWFGFKNPKQNQTYSSINLLLKKVRDVFSGQCSTPPCIVVIFVRETKNIICSSYRVRYDAQMMCVPHPSWKPPPECQLQDVVNLRGKHIVALALRPRDTPRLFLLQPIFPRPVTKATGWVGGSWVSDCVNEKIKQLLIGVIKSVDIHISHKIHVWYIYLHD